MTAFIVVTCTDSYDKNPYEEPELTGYPFFENSITPIDLQINSACVPAELVSSNTKKPIAILKTVGWTLFSIISVCMLYTGLLCLLQCPWNQNMPSILLIGGFLGILKCLLQLWLNMNTADENPRMDMLYGLLGVLYLFWITMKISKRLK